jgi:hypothetical protein
VREYTEVLSVGCCYSPEIAMIGGKYIRGAIPLGENHIRSVGHAKGLEVAVLGNKPPRSNKISLRECFQMVRSTLYLI